MEKYTWPAFDLIFFDCDSTLSTVEGIDELAKSRGLFDEVQQLTNAAMDGEVYLESIYDQRLQLLRPTRGEIRQIERLYRDTVVPDAKQVIEALLFLGKQVFIVSGGLYPAVRPFGEWLGVPPANIRAVKVAYDTFSGRWWDYQQDQWGQPPDVNYLKHDAGPLIQSSGKAEVIRELKNELRGRSMLIGDGMSDLTAQDEIDRFVGFGGVARRAGVEAEAEVYIKSPSLAPVLALATSSQEHCSLQQSAYAYLLQKGLALIRQQTVIFRKRSWQTAILENTIR